MIIPVEFKTILSDILTNPTVNKMKNYRQHWNTSCYEHCFIVALICYKIAKKLNWDYKSLTRAAMLHDLFLYDWRKKENGRKGFHALTHGKLACQNATKIFNLTKKEQDIIERHMFPVTPIPPNSKEGLLLTIIDKYSAIIEIKSEFHRKALNK